MKSLVVKFCGGIIVLWILLLGLLSVFPSSNSNNSNYPNPFGFGSSSGDNANGPHSRDETNQILRRIDAALQDIQKLKTNNAEMKRIIEGSNNNEGKVPNSNNTLGLSSGVKLNGGRGSPSSDYEKTRRLLELDLKEMWYSIRAHDKENAREIDFEQVKDIYKILRSNLNRLRDTDGFETFREKETAELSRIVQSRIHSLQNPKDCSKAKKLVCVLNKGCGFGCQVHHVCYCLVTAYATGRTLVLESKGWRYNRAGWDKVFLPLSESCTSPKGESRADWNGIHSENQVITLPIVDFLKPRPPFLPVSIPSEISPRLERIHGEPHIWWVGQFMKYILRPQQSVQEMLNEAKRKAGIEGVVVGLHIRRTDKIGTEASYHSLKEYMVHAEEYFDIKNKTSDGVPLKRKVFIASDDPSVISEAERSYPSSEWEILGDKRVAESAGLSQRYNGLNGIIRDVFLLSECDYLVCTFSSQVCRLAYELLQTKHTDASERFVSLDDIYYYGGGIGLDQKAYIAHKPRSPNELSLEIGDKIGIAGNHWNGMSKGTNRRTNKVGLYPSYKARNEYPKVNFPDNKWWSQSDNARRRR